MNKNCIILFVFITFVINRAWAQRDTQLTTTGIDTSAASFIDSSVNANKDSAKENADTFLPANETRYSADTLTFSASTFNVDSFGADLTLQNSNRLSERRHLTWQTDTAFKAFFEISGFALRNDEKQPAKNDTINNKPEQAQNKNVPTNEEAAKKEGMDGIVRTSQSKDHLFYTLSFIFLFLAFIKTLFPKYFSQLFNLSFQTVLSQKLTREQLLQNKLPSLLMNLLFIFSGGLFITLLAQHYKWVNIDYWWLLLFSASILSAVYIIKYLFINFAGWVFNARQPATNYSFIVFLINKILGVVLLPMLLIISFSDEKIKKVAITITGCIIVILFLYRYLFSLVTTRKSLNITAFHFFIYLCAVEILPLLIIYKALFNEIRKSN